MRREVYMPIIFWVTIIAVLSGVLLFGRAVRGDLRRTADKVKKFEDYCLGVRVSVDVVRTDLSLAKWRTQALERFTSKLDDINRCSTTVLDWDRFSDCQLHNDQACVDAFVRHARDAIPRPAD